MSDNNLPEKLLNSIGRLFHLIDLSNSATYRQEIISTAAQTCRESAAKMEQLQAENVLLANEIERLQRPTHYVEPESGETAETIEELAAMCCLGEVVELIPMRKFPAIYIIVSKEDKEVKIFETQAAAEAARSK